MDNHRLVLGFYGIGVEVLSPDPARVEEFRRDFLSFVPVGEGPTPVIKIRLRPESPSSDSTPRRSAGASREIIMDVGDRREIRHPGVGLARYDFSTESGEIISSDSHWLHEMGYLLLLSRVGFFLDRKGLHRLHALGFRWNGKTVLVLLPVGGGKTTLAWDLLQRDGVQLLSEDTPLVDERGRCWPFPIRMGVSGSAFLPDVPMRFQRLFRRRRHGDKMLVDTDCFPGRWVERGPLEPHVLLVGSGRFSSEGGLRAVGRWRVVFPLVWNLLIGVGVAQGREYILRWRWSALWHLGITALRRVRALVFLGCRARAYQITLGPKTEDNVQRIRELCFQKEGQRDVS